MDLQSIAATTKAVPFCNGTVDVIGLSLRKLTQLIVKYPELVTLVGGKADIANLVMSAPEAALSIVALGTPDMIERDSEKLLRTFDDAAVGQQIDLLGSIIDLTFAGERAGPVSRKPRRAAKLPQATKRGSGDPSGDLAELIEFLCSEGHPLEQVLDFTPKQASAFASLAQKRIKRKRAFDLTIAAMGARGESDEVKKLVKEWSQ